MEQRKEIMGIGISVVVLALVIRLFAGGTPAFWSEPGALSLLVYLQTGRVVRYPQSVPTTPTTVTTTPPPVTEPLPTQQETSPQQPSPITFSPEDGEKVKVNDWIGYELDKTSLLLSPLEWDLRQEAPTVLILHTHATESYTKQPEQNYVEDSDYRTLDENYNMISVGAELSRILEAGGIKTLHARELHDYPSYSGSYSSARKTIAYYLERYPSIRMVIDLHRDALDFEEDPQLSTLASVDGTKSAQLMMVAGTDTNLTYPGWRDNLALGIKLTAVLEELYPGITRPIQLRPERFNLDMTPGSLLIEVGANGDSHDQALVAVRALGAALLTLANGANLQDAPPL